MTNWIPQHLCFTFNLFNSTETCMLLFANCWDHQTVKPHKDLNDGSLYVSFQYKFI